MLYLGRKMQTLNQKRVFEGKVAFVGGGSRGIGLAIAKKLAEKGAHIVFSYLRSRSDASKADDLLRSFQVRSYAIRGNMGNENQVRKIFETIQKEFGYLDIIVHNAATGTLKPVLDLTGEEWQKSLDINLRALFLSAQLGVPLMNGRNGKIVSISSHGSHRCLPDYSAVGVAKSGIESLSRYLAIALAPQGINVNVVISGIIETKSLKGIPGYQEMVRLAKTKTPAGRIGLPEDIAEVVAFLCSEESRWIVGQTIVADGGYSLLA